MPDDRVYLTFDDGPVPEATTFVLETLNRYDIKATFFCLGCNIEQHPELFERLKQEGHIIGNHTYDHPDGWKTKNRRYFENIRRCSHLTGTRLFRPPYGRLKRSQYKVLREQFDLIMWDVVSYDFVPGLNIEKSLKHITTKTRPGSIVVFHDSMKSLPNLKQLLPAYIEYCLSENYKFGTL